MDGMSRTPEFTVLGPQKKVHLELGDRLQYKNGALRIGDWLQTHLANVDGDAFSHVEVFDF
jgi:hypothetical protein